jgi:RNA polymerase sigma factor (sigma-70 family)
MSRFLQIDVPAELIAAAQAGDSTAHAAIYRSCSRHVYTLIRRLISRAAIADELHQDVFVEILKSISTYSGQASFAAWVRSIAVNKCLMYLRSPLHRTMLWIDEYEEGTFEVSDNSSNEHSSSNARDLERALAQLAPLTRAVVWLHDVEGYTHQEIAQSLRRTPSFSKSQLSRAHQKLREILDPQAEAPACTSLSTDY